MTSLTDWIGGSGTSDAEAYHWSADGGHSWHQRTQQQQRIFDGAPRHRNRSRERWGPWRCGMVWGWMEWTRSFHLQFFFGCLEPPFFGEFPWPQAQVPRGGSGCYPVTRVPARCPKTLPRSEDLRNFPVTQVTVEVGPGSVDNDSSSSIMQS